MVCNADVMQFVRPQRGYGTVKLPRGRRQARLAGAPCYPRSKCQRISAAKVRNGHNKIFISTVTEYVNLAWSTHIMKRLLGFIAVIFTYWPGLPVASLNRRSDGDRIQETIKLVGKDISGSGKSDRGACKV